MIEKFTPEELAIIIDELTKNGRLPEKQDKRNCARTAVNRIDSAINEKYGGESYSLQSVVHNAVVLFCDIITGNCKHHIVNTSRSNYLTLERRRQVEVNAMEWQAVANKFADLFVELIDATPREVKESAKERENGGLVYNALIAKLEAQKGENDA